MAQGYRAPKQWSLTKNETINSFESWKQNITYILNLDKNFAKFLVAEVTWQKKSTKHPLRGFTSDGDTVPVAERLTAEQKVSNLEMMLGFIANFCPIISRNTIVKNSTSIGCVWQAIRLHYGFQSSGSHLLDFADIKFEPDERPEDLYQRLVAFVEDNLLTAEGGIQHYGETPDVDEELSPTLENIIVLHWLHLLSPDLPRLVKQRYGTELRSKTLASIKPEISQAMNSLLDELRTTEDARVMRTSNNFPPRKRAVSKPNIMKVCPLCKQAGRSEYNHFLSKCRFLPAKDKEYLSRVRLTGVEDDISDSDQEESPSHEEDGCDISATRRIGIKQSPYMFAFHNQHSLQLTLDTGAESNMIKAAVAKYIGAKIKKSSHKAFQADGRTPLKVLGETKIPLTRGSVTLYLEALVVEALDVDIIAGTTFLATNDITIRPARHEIILNNGERVSYGSDTQSDAHVSVRRTSAHLIRAPYATVVWPGDNIEVDLPFYINPDAVLAVEPRTPCTKNHEEWPQPHLVQAVGGKIRVVNDSTSPRPIKKNEQFCHLLPVNEIVTPNSENMLTNSASTSHVRKQTVDYKNVEIDPDRSIPEEVAGSFHNLVEEFHDVFDHKFEGYNGASGPIQAVVNMGPTLPPQRKGRLPQYPHTKMVQLQEAMDELEMMGVLRKPEDVNICVEYVNPSFLIKKPSGGHRLVTAFADVGRYTKPQPSLMPDVDSTLRRIAQWNYITATDLKKAFYQIPINRESMKYCGVSTPFKGLRVYARSAMGMPGSETALEELMSRVLGELIQEGVVAKLADDLFIGGNTPEDLHTNLRRTFLALHQNGLKLSPSKTIICPKSTMILGWIWSRGTLKASSHRITTLASCNAPKNVRGLRAFIGAYRALSRVLPNCAQSLAPLDEATTGKESKDEISWDEPLQLAFQNAQKDLSNHKEITLPRPSDQLWIVTDASVKQNGIGATLYVGRNNNLHLAGFYSAKLRPHQIRWLPCEIEALSIAASIKHFSPYIVQSDLQTVVLTDSKPCVQAVEKLCRGEFSNSPRMTTFLSAVSRYQIAIRHLAGAVNIPSDFASRNAPECTTLSCQVCTFVSRLEESVVRNVTVKDVINGAQRLPFTNRSSWIQVQHECPDLRRVHAHLSQGTRPSKKQTHIGNVKRYLRNVTIAKDGLLVVKQDRPLVPTAESIVIPQNALHGLLTALHLRFDHPTTQQLKVMCQRYFYALDMEKAVKHVSESCHMCCSLRSLKKTRIEQSTEDPPVTVGRSFAADVIKRNRQNIFILRETVTSYTVASFIEDERHESLRNALIKLCIEMRPLDGPFATVRVDGAPGFLALRDDSSLHKYRIALEIGRTKNVNKNPVGERAVQELENEILRIEPGGGPISTVNLAAAVASLNTRIRGRGLSAREMWTQRDQFTLSQLPVQDLRLISEQNAQRTRNHPYSEYSKAPMRNLSKPCQAQVGDLVYIKSDLNKTRARDRYLVVATDKEWCHIKKFTGSQLRPSSYRVKRNECFMVPSYVDTSPCKGLEAQTVEDDHTDLDIHEAHIPPVISAPEIPTELTEPLDTLQSAHHSPQQDADWHQPPLSPCDSAPETNNDVDLAHRIVPTPDRRQSARKRNLPKKFNDFILY